MVSLFFFVNNINIYYQFQQLSYKVRIKPGQADGTALLLLVFVRHSTDELLLLLSVLKLSDSLFVGVLLLFHDDP